MDFSELLGLGMTQSQKVRKSFWAGTRSGAAFGAGGLALVAFQGATAERGAKLPSIAGQAAAVGLGIPLTGFASAAVSLIPGVGPLAAVVIGNLLADYGELRVGSSLIKKFRTFSNLDKTLRHLEMGGSYQDSLSAQRQRFLAIQDMNASMIPGRRFLGQEALLMHR